MAKRHIVRPTFPWRIPDLTECGRALAGLEHLDKEAARDALITAKPAIPAKTTMDELDAAKRAMFTQARVCRVCWDKATCSWPWDRSPVAVVRRECDWGPNWGGPRRGGQASRFELELRAIAELIEAHRGEFDGLLDGHAVMNVLSR